VLRHSRKEEPEFMLDGKITRSDLQQHFNWFTQGYAGYHPNDTAITRLKPYAGDLHVLVIMGTWCGDSQEYIPAFFKVADSIGLTNDKIEMIAVNRNKVSDSVDVSSLKITNVPTFILSYKGTTLGRIVESPTESVEKDMLRLTKATR
jgi:hypothetical protein